MFEINDIKLEMDVMDANFVEKFESELDKVVTKSKISKEKLKKGDIKRSQSIRELCTLVFDFFNNVWGKDTHKKVFGDRCNLRDCLNAFDKCVNIFKEEVNREEKEMSSKYSSNRAQRRSNNKYNNKKNYNRKK